jgi:hypothetical protein
MKVALILALFVTAATMTATAQTQIFVPGTASGYFGGPQDQAVPFIPAITVSGPATITVTYISGTVTDCCSIDAGPDGARFNATTEQFPLQETIGIAGGYPDRRRTSALRGEDTRRCRSLFPSETRSQLNELSNRGHSFVVDQKQHVITGRSNVSIGRSLRVQPV